MKRLNLQACCTAVIALAGVVRALAGAPPVNDLCSGAIPFPVGFTWTDNTTIATPDPEIYSCGATVGTSAGLGVEKGVWFTVTGTGSTLTATTCGISGSFDTIIRVYCGDCSQLSCVGGNDDTSTNCTPSTLLSRVSWCTIPGQTYLVYLSGYQGASGFYGLTITDDLVPCTGAVSCVTCSLFPPGGATIEPEVCGTDSNGGCSATPASNQFTDLIGQCNIYFGTIRTFVQASGARRDTDWYRFTLSAQANVTWTVTAEFPALLLIEQLNGAGGTCPATIIASANSTTCLTNSVSALLNAGTYAAFVAPGTPGFGVFTGFPCGVNHEYFATLIINDGAPVITQQPQNQSLCPGSPVSFSVVAPGATLYQWRRGTTNLTNGGRFSGVDTPTLTINPAFPGDIANNYNCVVTNNCNSATSNNAALSAPQGIQINAQPQPVSVCEGGSASFSVNATGNGLSYRWRHFGIDLNNGGNISGATSATLMINPVGPGDAGDYDVVISDSCLGQLTSDTAALSIIVPVVYVRSGASGANNGSSWNDAFTDLQAAIDFANSTTCTDEVWIASGMYSRSCQSFQLRGGVCIYGGFAGGETSLGQRNPAANIAILQASDCSPSAAPPVVTTVGAGTAAGCLDGVTIQGHPNNICQGTGGCLYIDRDSIAFANVRFTGGKASLGGGVAIVSASPVLTSCVIDNNRGDGGGGVYIADGSPTLQNCTLTGNVDCITNGTGGGGVLSSNAAPTLIGCSITGNHATNGSGGIHVIGGVVTLSNCSVSTNSNALGSGGTSLAISDGSMNLYNTTVVGAAGQLSGNRTLSGGTNSYLTLDGALTAQGTSHISGFADIVFLPTGSLRMTDSSLLDYSTVHIQAGLPYGQFLAESSASLQHNEIYAEGDRYVDYDAATYTGTMTNNHFYILVTNPNETRYGSLFEARGLETCTEDCGSGAHPVVSIPAQSLVYWSIERLDISAGRHVNIVNRFDYGNGDTDEVLYVNELRLGANAILNTGLQRLYYRTLKDLNGQPLVRDPQDPSAPMANGSRLVDIPLLGFSLKVIAMDDPGEYSLRVKIRNRDSTDVQPMSPPYKQGKISRIISPLPGAPNNGAMKMCTTDAGYIPASSVAAHGSFARAAENLIIVAFKYRFTADPLNAAELVVFLSDDPDVGDSRLEIARLTQPPAGRLGSIGSDLATFYGVFPRGALVFNRGCYVELEMRGANSCVEIDDWDPQIDCQACADFNGTQVVDNLDHLILLSEYGRTLNPLDPEYGGNRYCLDSRLNSDKYIDLSDLLAWDSWLSNGTLNACADGGIAAACPPSPTPLPPLPLLPSDDLIIAGKPSGAADQEDRLFTISTAGACLGPAQLPASMSGSPKCFRGNGRLMRDSYGRLHQIHSLQGLIRLVDAQVVLQPGVVTMGNGTQVRVGAAAGSAPQPPLPLLGAPLLDAAFSPTSPDIVYVVPVIVTEPGPSDGVGRPYRAAAKLLLLGNGTFQVMQLYGRNPMPISGVSRVVAGGEVIFNPDQQRQREIEVDTQGNVYVLSSYALDSNDWLMLYDESAGNSSERVLHLSGIGGPAQMLVSSAVTDRLYLAASVYTQPNVLTRVYPFSIQRSGAVATGVTPLAAVIDIDNTNALTPNPAFPTYTANVTALAEHPIDGRLFVVGFTGPYIPSNLSIDSPQYLTAFSGNAQLFTRPTLAVVPGGAGGTYLSTGLSCQSLSLPVALAFTTSWRRGDMNCDGLVNNFDIDPFVMALLDPIGANPPVGWPAGPSCWSLRGLTGDVDGSGALNNFDIDPFVMCLLSGPPLGAGCP